MSPFGSLIVEVVDVTSREQVTDVLRKHDVDTVISQYFLLKPDWDTEFALVDAAVAAGVRRFAPTCFAMPNDRATNIEWYKFKIMAEERVLKTNMEFTNFACGIFMNFFGSGAPEQQGESPLGYLHPMKLVLDVENGTGDIPGTGDEPVTFTEIHDIARGVAQVCRYEGKWQRETGYMIGDCLSYNEVVRIIKEETGREISVNYTSKEKLHELIATESDPLKHFLYQCSLAMVNGQFTYPNSVGNTGEWKAVSVREYVRKWWPKV